MQNCYPFNQWQEIIGNSDTQLFLRCTDEVTAEFISFRTGDVTVGVSSEAKQFNSWRVSDYTPEYRRDIYYIFPPLMPNTSTRVVLKKPKSDSSIRCVWIPKTVAYILKDWKKAPAELKEFLGDEYLDFDLVVALANERPCEGKLEIYLFILLARLLILLAKLDIWFLPN